MNYETYSATDFAGDELFIKWVKAPDPETTQFWEQWLQQHPDQKRVVEEAQLLVQSIHFQLPGDTQDRVDAVWQRIQTTNKQTIGKHEDKAPFLSAFRSWQKWAAILIGPLLVATVLLYTIYKDKTLQYQTAFGETQRIVLPDSSVVILNANSRLTLHPDWMEDREVWLEGEAFFQVRKKSLAAAFMQGKPVKFTVHTQQAQVQVLGTEFNVSERAQRTVVVLNSGKIKLTLPSEEASILMKPGDLVEVNSKVSKLTRKVVNPEVYSAWKENEWILNDLPLAEVAAKIEETYGVKVIISNPAVASAVVTGAVPTDNLNNLLEALAATFPIKITRKDQQILIE